MKIGLIILIVILKTIFGMGADSVCGNQDGSEPYSISVETLAEIILAQENIPNDSLFIIDARTHQEFKAGTLKGAVNIPVQTLNMYIPELLELQADKPKMNLILFCRTKNRSCHAANILLKAGLKNISVAPGWHFWNDENMGKLRVKPE